MISGLQDVGIKRAGDQADLRMAQLHQVFDGQLKAFLAVAADGGDIRVFFYIIVIENGGKFGGTKLLHPGIQKGEAEDESSLIALLHHKNAVGSHPLELHGHRNDVHDPAFRLSFLFKAQNQLVSELIGRVIIHVFNQNAELFLLFLKTFVGIPQFNGGFQDLSAHFLTDISGMVETL